MVEFVKGRSFVALALRILVPLASATTLALWVAEQASGWAGIAAGTALGVGVVLAWLTIGFRGDPSRAGEPLLHVTPHARLALEITVAAAGVLAAAWGLGSAWAAAVLAAAAVAFLTLRVTRLRESNDGRAAAAHDEDEAVPQWSARGEDGSFRFGRSFIVDAPRTDVWDFIWDVRELAGSIPGCESVEELTPQCTYTARVRRKLGPFLIRMSLTIDIEDSEEPRSIRAVVTGRDERLRSTVIQRLELSLREVDGGCRVRIATYISIEGTLATMDAYVIERNLDQTIGDFAEALSGKLAARALAPSR